jgi:hypothetical protein
VPESQGCSWIPIEGKFEFNDDSIIFNGGLQEVDAPNAADSDEEESSATSTTEAPSEKVMESQVGIVVCGQRFTEGRIGVDVEFDAVSPTYVSLGDIILQYEPNTSRS